MLRNFDSGLLNVHSGSSVEEGADCCVHFGSRFFVQIYRSSQLIPPSHRDRWTCLGRKRHRLVHLLATASRCVAQLCIQNVFTTPKRGRSRGASHNRSLFFTKNFTCMHVEYLQGCSISRADGFSAPSPSHHRSGKIESIHTAIAAGLEAMLK